MSHESPGRETPETGNALASQASSSLLLWLTLAAVAIAPMIMYGAGYGVANGEGAAVALLCIVVVLGLGGWIRRRMRIGLRSFLIFVAVLSVILSFIGQWFMHTRRLRMAAEKIQQSGARLNYNMSEPDDAWFRTPSGLMAPSWLLDLLGKDTFASVHSAEFNGEAPADALETLAHEFPDVVALHLFVTTIPAESLLQLEKLENLEQLNLDYTQSTDTVIAHIGKMTKLESLSIRMSGVTDRGIEAACRLPRLKTLWGGGTALVTDASMKHIGGVTNLENLVLSKTKITDRGVLELCAAKRLRWLAIDGNRVGDAPAAALAALPNLRHLQMSSTDLTDAGLLELAASKSIESLDVQNTLVTRKGVERFRKLNSKCDLRQNAFKENDD